MKTAIIGIGNEILRGSIVDTNSGYIAKTLTEKGYEVESISVVGDDMEKMETLFKCYASYYDVVITTGGLGPTFDDLTVEALSRVSNRRLKLNRNAYHDVVKKVKSKNVNLKLSHLKQVYLPKGCGVIKNDYGTAPGITIKTNKAYFIAMPGVPSEMKPMFENYVLPELLRLFPPKQRFRYDLKFIGVAESDMDEFLSAIDTTGAEIILNAQEGELAVRLLSQDKNRIEHISKLIADKFSINLYSYKDEKIEDVVDNLLIEKGLSLGIMEDFSKGYLTFLMADKKSFAGSVVSGGSYDIKDADLIKKADVVLYPNSLEGNRFVVDIYFKQKLTRLNTRYTGNKNFMKKAVSKRALGHLYEFLKRS